MLIDDETLEAMARAHDGEEADAFCNPDLWDGLDLTKSNDRAFREARIAAMRCAVEALMRSGGYRVVGAP